MARKSETRSAPARRWWRRPVIVLPIVGVLVLAGAGAALGIWLFSGHGASERLVAASTGTYDETVTASGTVTPTTTSNLSFGSAGTVTAVDVQVGQTVTAGQSLATIDPTALQSQLTLAQAVLAQAQTQQTAVASGTSTQKAAAAATVAADQAKVQVAQTAVSGATLTSPIDGVVAAVNVTVGAQSGSSTGGSAASTSAASTTTKSAASTSSSSSAAITVISQGSWVVDTTVSNTDLATLKTGMQAQITPTGATQPIFGTVQSIGVVASSSTGGVAQFPVVIAVTGTPTGLYDGTVASVSITTKELDDVLVVPTLAVQTQNGQAVVKVSSGGQQQVVDVTVGEVFGTETQITAGLNEGDEVVVQTPAGRSGSGSGSSTTGGSGRSGSGFGSGTGGAGTGTGTGSGGTGAGTGAGTGTGR